MKTFIPYEKLSKKEKRRIDRERRATWGSLSPVTRKGANKKLYNRKTARKHWEDPNAPGCFHIVEDS